MKTAQPWVSELGLINNGGMMVLTGGIATLTLVLGLDGIRSKTTGGSFSPDTVVQSAAAKIQRIDVVAKYIFAPDHQMNLF